MELIAFFGDGQTQCHFLNTCAVRGTFKNNDYFTDYCASNSTDTDGTIKYEDCEDRFDLNKIL